MAQNSRSNQTSKKSSGAKRGPGRPPGSKNRNTGSASSRTGTSAGRNNQAPHTKSAARRSNEKKSMSPTVKKELTLWGSLAVCILMFIANLGLAGVVGNGISWLFFGLFGWMQYLLPIIAFLAVMFIVSNKNNSVARVNVIIGFVGLVLVSTLLQLIVNAVQNRDYTTIGWGESFQSWSNIEGARPNPLTAPVSGGFFGGSLAKLLVTWFDHVAPFIIVIVLIIACIVLLTGRSIFHGLKRTGQKIGDTVAYDLDQYSQNMSEKQRERDRKRARVELNRSQQKVKGVAVDTEIREDSLDVDNMHEIHPGSSIGSRRTKEEAYVQSQPKDLFAPDAENAQAGQVPVRNEGQSGEQEYFSFEQAGDQYMDEQASNIEEIGEVEEYIPPKPVRKQKDYLKPGNTWDGKAEPEEAFAPVNHTSAADEDLWEESPRSAAEYERDIPVSHTEQPKQENRSEVAQPIEESFVSASMEKAKKPRHRKYTFPTKDLLAKGAGATAGGNSDQELQETARKLQTIMATFGVNAKVVGYSRGPAVTRYELQPELGVKVSKVVSLADDIKLGLAAADIRIEAPIPGKSLIGIEVPNRENSSVLLGDLIRGAKFSQNKSKIAFAAGKDISGEAIVADIAKMPHLLIAGATGSGKSVCINTIVMSILYHASPDDVKLIMIDPKVVELSVYNGIPHLLTPVVTDPKKAAGALNWAVAEMTDRYNKFAQTGCRDMAGYNEKVDQIDPNIPEDQRPEKMAQIVIIIDELADLMMVASKEVEDSIVRLAQLARAAGIHLVIATQRPSVNVITGLIKANVPSRIAFAVSSGVDSRTIIDMYGAEKLLGKGDMLYYPQGMQKPLRVQGAFVSDDEVNRVVDFIKTHNGATQYSEAVEKTLSSPGSYESGGIGGGDDRDQFFADAGRAIIDKERASIGMLQRLFKIGFNRAARIMDQLGEAGVVGPEEGTKPRKVLMTMDEFEDYLRNN